MLEFIGTAVVLLITWKFLKVVVSAAIKGHQFRSIDHAMSLGVPQSFAQAMINQRSIMKQSMAHLANHVPDFRMKDVYVQQGEAIAMLYQGYLQEQKAKSLNP